jgi:hypothetical protein
LGVGVAGLAVIVTPVTAAAGATSQQPAAARAPQPRVQVLNDDVVAPYQLKVGRDGLFVADAYLNAVARLDRRGLQKVVSGPRRGDVAGLAVNERGEIAYASRVVGRNGTASSTLTVVPRRGRAVQIDLLRFEQRHNPDRDVTYGLVRPNDCQKRAFASLGGANRRGVADSRGYAVAALPGGGWVVADSAANDLLRVGPRGQVSTLAVLPAQPVTITREAAAELRLPRCVIGATYRFEPSPTDVEVYGRDLVVTLLPGSLGGQGLGRALDARGSVQWVDAKNGRVRQVAGGFQGASNLAVGPRGRIFVAENWADQISVIADRRVVKYADLDRVVSLEWANDRLYGGTLGQWGRRGVDAPGKIVSIG